MQCADRESNHQNPLEVLMLVCVAHQDVCRSSRVIPLLQTPGGPHQEGKSCSHGAESDFNKGQDTLTLPLFQ